MRLLSLPKIGALTGICAGWRLCGRMDSTHAFIISGNGDVIEPDDGIVAIGSGGSFATAAANMLVKYSS